MAKRCTRWHGPCLAGRQQWRCIVAWLGFVALLLLWLTPVQAQVQAQAQAQAQGPIQEVHACAPVLQLMEAAKGPVLGDRGEDNANAGRYRPPTEGWGAVRAYDMWRQRWPEHDGTVWYRQVWTVNCPAETPSGEPLSLGLYAKGPNMAGAIHVNGELLWRDVSLVEPLSRSWFVSRHWRVPAHMLKYGNNEIMIRVVGHAQQGAGPGLVLLGPLPDIQARAEGDQLWQRTAFMLNTMLSGMLGLLFAMVWWMRRQEVAYGWYALLSLLWVLYLLTLLAESPWPFASSLNFARFNLILLGLYCAAFCTFTWRFGEQHFPRTEPAMWTLLGISVVALVVVPEAHLHSVSVTAWFFYVLMFQANCLQFVVHAWRRGTSELLLLAACWLAFLLVGMHDMLQGLHGQGELQLLTPFTSLLASVFMSLLLAWRLTDTTRRLEGFNAELEARVAQARLQLAGTLRREHAQALQNVKLQERLEIAHDLHDGLGGSLVRAMAFVEQTPQALDQQRVLSLFKVLRDDLRQVIDHGSSANVTVPESPVTWLAPLRHRFTRLFDDLDVAIRWDVPAQWQAQPSALQCLGMTRVLEEALSNVIKHSRADRVEVVCQQPEPEWWVIEVIDNGVGFDVDAVQEAGLSVGMRSMAARAERMQGQLRVHSAPGRTVLRLRVKLAGPSRAQPFADTPV